MVFRVFKDLPLFLSLVSGKGFLESLHTVHKNNLKHYPPKTLYSLPFLPFSHSFLFPLKKTRDGPSPRVPSLGSNLLRSFFPLPQKGPVMFHLVPLFLRGHLLLRILVTMVHVGVNGSLVKIQELTLLERCLVRPLWVPSHGLFVFSLFVVTSLVIPKSWTRRRHGV